MKERISSIMFAPIMLFSMAVPGFAAGGSDSADRLAAVTGKVKRALGLDTAANGTNSLRQTRYHFQGTVLLNGCPSPLRFSLTDFSDEAEVPENLLGYAALAQAMNVAQGDSAGRLDPSQSATRGDAGVMLLAFMQRG